MLDKSLLFATRSLRMFSFGSVGVIFAVYLHELGLSDQRIGMLLTLTLLGDSVISLAITIIADKVGKWRMQLLGCLLILLAGLMFAFPWSQSFWLLTTAATIGVVSPSGNEVGPFQALEQSMLAELVAPTARTAMFAWYNFVGYLATALGSAEAGKLVDILQLKQHWTSVESCRAVFFQYSVIGGAMIVILVVAGFKQWLSLPRIEVAISDEALLQPLNTGAESPSEQSSTSGSYHQTLPSEAREECNQKWGMSSKSIHVMIHLSLLFALDSFAGGLLTGTLLAYYFKVTYGVSTVFLGGLLFVCNIIAGISSLASGPIATKFGMVNTMVFTHLPSNVLVLMIPMMPTLNTALLILFLRYSISQMDVAPRQSFVAGVVLPQERTIMLGVVNVVKSLAASFGPLATGYLAANNMWRWSFFLCGGLKIAYDVALLISARHLKPDTEQSSPTPSS